MQNHSHQPDPGGLIKFSPVRAPNKLTKLSANKVRSGLTHFPCSSSEVNGHPPEAGGLPKMRQSYILENENNADRHQDTGTDLFE